MATDDVLKNITVVRNNNKLLSSHNCICSTSVRPVSKRRWVSNPTLWGTQAVAHDLRPHHSPMQPNAAPLLLAYFGHHGQNIMQPWPGRPCPSLPHPVNRVTKGAMTMSDVYHLQWTSSSGPVTQPGPIANRLQTLPFQQSGTATRCDA